MQWIDGNLVRGLLVWVFCLLSVPRLGFAGNDGYQRLRFNNLPSLPDSIGLKGATVGPSRGALLAVGGTTAPFGSDGPGRLQDTITVLSEGDSAWQAAGKLPSPLAFGASAHWNDGVLLIGGSGAEGVSAEVLLLKYSSAESQVTVQPLPALPYGLTHAGAAVLGDTLYVAGGQESLTAAPAVDNFWAIDLSQPTPRRQWRTLESWPGPPRIRPVVAVQDGAVFVMGGWQTSDERSTGRHIEDAYRFTPKQGWTRIADLPAGCRARAAVPYGQTHVLLFGQSGDWFHPATDGASPLPGTTTVMSFAYHTITDTWLKLNNMSDNVIVDGATLWNDAPVVLGHPASKVAGSFVYRADVIKPARHFYTIDHLVVIVYLGAMLAMGVYFSRRTKSTADFFLAGGRIPWWLAGIAIRATQISSIGLMATPAKAYATDWVYVLGVLTIPLVTPVVIYFYLPFFFRLKVTTAYQYLEERFNLAVRMFGSAAFVVFQLGRVAIVMFLPALAISAVTGIDVYVCILTAGIICSLYTVLGGIEAVMWTDLVQEIILIGGPIYCVVVAILGSDGQLTGFLETASANGKFHMLDWRWDPTVAVVWVVLLGNWFINLSTYTSDQAVIQRYLSTRDEKQAARAMWVNAIFVVPWGLMVFVLGTALYTFYRSHPELVEIGSKTDAIVPLFMAYQLPPGITGLVIAALFAATMSTVDSGIHSMSTALVNDFYGRWKPTSTDQHRLNLARVLTLFLGAFATGAALMMAAYNIQSLWDLFLKIIGLLGSGLAGLFVLGIFTRRANALGALVGVAVSTTMLFYVQNYTTVHFFLYSGVGFMTCIVVGYLVSLLSPVRGKDLTGLTIYTLGKMT